MMRVLFVCEGNVGRSQMAEAMLRAYGNGYDPASVGTRVGEKIGERIGDLPAAKHCVTCMKEAGFCISDLRRNGIQKAWVDWADRVVVMANPKTCPEYVFKHGRVNFWDVEDPYLLTEEETREIISDVRRRVLAMIEEDKRMVKLILTPPRRSRWHLISIPLIVLATALAGSWLTQGGMDWYSTIALPVWTPSGEIIGMVWTTIFILSGAAAIIAWRSMPRNTIFAATFIAFIANAFLNIFWSFLFFRLHIIDAAFLEAGLLAGSVLFLIGLTWERARIASILLIPYLMWVSFATYLTFKIFELNS
ncbi:MAG: tryptophan-rich sensory protein [bacterium]